MRSRSARHPLGTFSPAQNGYIDGGVFANNPSLCAMTRVLANIPQLSTKDMCVLSLGTGVRPMRIELDPSTSWHWGLARWAPHLVDLLFESSNRTVGGASAARAALALRATLSAPHCPATPL